VEYVIWGIPKDGKDETLLLTKFEGETITSREVAERLEKILISKHGVTKTRIQEINLTDNKVVYGN